MCLKIFHINFYSQYSLGEQITKTNFSQVYHCNNKDGNNKLVAKIQNPITNPNNIKSEIAILRHLSHPKYTCELVYNEYKFWKCFLVFKCIKGPHLGDYLKGDIDYKEKIKITRDLLSAFTYIQNKGVIHRDIKLDNIMVDENRMVKIIDFGFSIYHKNIDNFVSNIPTGAYLYMCPEMLSVTFYGAECDTWSLGVLLYYMFKGDYPYKFSKKIANSYAQFHQYPNILKQTPDYSHLDDEVVVLLKKMLVCDGYDRPKISDIDY